MGRDRTGGTGTPPASHPGEGLRHVWTRRRPRPLTHHATPPTRRPPPLEPTHHAPQPQTTPPKPARHAPGSLKTPPHSGPAPPHLGVAAEAGALPRPHGPQRRFPHRQLELLAGDQLHGLPPRPAVIQRRLLIPAPQRPVVESGLRGRSRPRRHHSDRGCGCGGRTTWRMRASLVSPSPPPPPALPPSKPRRRRCVPDLGAVAEVGQRPGALPQHLLVHAVRPQLLDLLRHRRPAAPRPASSLLGRLRRRSALSGEEAAARRRPLPAGSGTRRWGGDYGAVGGARPAGGGKRFPPCPDTPSPPPTFRIPGRGGGFRDKSRP